MLNFCCLIASCQRAEPESYLISEGFEGKIAIVLNTINGQPKIYEQSRRIYKIDTTGILLTQFGINNGFINCQYFYVDSIGRRKVLRNIDDVNLTINEDEIGIFQSRTGVSYGNSGTPSSIDTQEFIISSKKNLKLFTTPEYQKYFRDKLRRIVGHEF